MKIAVSSTGNNLGSSMDQRFGRGAYFIVTDSDTMEFEAIDNGGAGVSGGAGIASAQTIIDKGVSVVITGNVGPNAMNVLQAAEIEIFRGESVSVKENVEKFNNGRLNKMDTAVPQHFGAGFKGGSR